ncbi:MAG: acetyl-CoA hydrolase/transferase C-terminal domain-containing protein [Oscillospiraceae bacterium]
MTTVKDVYLQKLCTPAEIANQLQSGWTCCSDIGLGIPYAITDAIGDRARRGDLTGITMHTILDTKPMPCYDPELAQHIHGVSWFSGGGARKAVNGGYGDVMPCYYRDMPALFDQFVDIDALCIVVAPMDRNGYFSAGVTASNTATMLDKAKRIYLEVNAEMPRISSAPMLHISQVTALCEHNAPLPVLDTAPPDEISSKIGAIIAERICDGATIQLGIGSIPNAVGLALLEKHHLGIHTEMFTDSMVALMKSGAVDNSKKPIHRGRSVTTFAMGNAEMYEYLHDNPAIEMLPVDHVNDPAVISQHPNFVSINAALEVDFYGQVCAESLGARHISGTGGQVDYVRGATQSQGGMSFIAFPSTAKNGTVSKIAPMLTQGAIVTTGKNDVDNIVTEYGIAKLRGQPLSQRVKNLIAIAHPDFRDQLTFAAKKQFIII